MSIFFSICSISWEMSCDFSPCVLYASCSNESITCMGAISLIFACWTSYHIISCYASFSLLHKSCSSLSFCFNSYNSLFVSSILCFYPCLCMILLSWCHLLASISKVAFNTSEFTLNLKLCLASALSTTFLLPLSCTGCLHFIVVDDTSL